MEKPKTNEPTFPAPMIVGSGLGGEQAGAFQLSLLDWILREEEVSLLFPIEGEISNWIKELWAKPIHLDPEDFPANNKAPVPREAIAAFFADPQNEGASAWRSY